MVIGKESAREVTLVAPHVPCYVYLSLRVCVCIPACVCVRLRLCVREGILFTTKEQK